MVPTRKIYSLIAGLFGIILFFLFSSRINAAQVGNIFTTSIPGAEFVGTQACADCHGSIVKGFERTIHGQFAIKEKEPSGEGCESCHGAGSKHIEVGGGKGVSIINPRKNPEMCFKCHLEKKAEFSLQYHHPVVEGKISCSDCHNVHSEEAVPGSATSLEDRNDTCFKCHPEKKGPYVFEHDAMREGCEICHTVHGSVNEKLLVAKDNNLCLKCHYEQKYNTVSSGGGSAMYIGGWPHWHSSGSFMDTSTMGKTTCISCHGDVHGSNFHPRYIRYSVTDVSANSCLSCH